MNSPIEAINNLFELGWNNYMRPVVVYVPMSWKESISAEIGKRKNRKNKTFDAFDSEFALVLIRYTKNTFKIEFKNDK
jgi:hypothetical protein